MPHSTQHVDALDISECIKSSYPSIPSPDGLHIATVSSSTLSILLTSTFETIRTIDLSSSISPINKNVALRWSPKSHSQAFSNRILVSTSSKILVYDLHDPAWSATISNGSSSAGCNTNVDFGADDAQVIAFSEFGAALTIWCLHTGKSIEIRDPKFPTGTRGFARNKPGRKGVAALLSRQGAQDILSLHAASCSSIIKTIILPTVDAQGLKWSPNGRWIAVWDTPSLGYKILIYTADGNLFRTYTGDYFDDALAGLGVRTIEWSPNGECLAIGGYEKRITLLSTKTFSPAIYLSHPLTANPARCPVYQETSSAYTLATSSINPPSPSSSTSTTTSSNSASHSQASPQSTTHLSFSPTSTLLATISSATPSTVWIWDLTALTLRCVLVQHAPVKQIAWHRSSSSFSTTTEDSSLLLLIRTQATDGLPGLYLWSSDVSTSAEPNPRVLPIPADLPKSPTGTSTSTSTHPTKLDAQFLHSTPSHPTSPRILLTTPTASIIISPYGLDLPFPSSDPIFPPHPLSYNISSHIETNKLDIALQTTLPASPLPSSTAQFAEAKRREGDGNREDDDDDDDSLYEILTGRPRSSRLGAEPTEKADGTGAVTAGLQEQQPQKQKSLAQGRDEQQDDTFHDFNRVRSKSRGGMAAGASAGAGVVKAR